MSLHHRDIEVGAGFGLGVPEAADALPGQKRL
jgi:hypothetical protein